jgi:hypothetical protein
MIKKNSRRDEYYTALRLKLCQKQDIQKDDKWQKKMIYIEMRVSQNPDFQRIALHLRVGVSLKRLNYERASVHIIITSANRNHR